MGTSTLLKLMLKDICAKNGIEALIDSCAFGEAMGYLMDKDIIITSPEWKNMIPQFDGEFVIVKNLMNKEIVAEGLLSVVKEKYPNELKG